MKTRRVSVACGGSSGSRGGFKSKSETFSCFSLTKGLLGKPATTCHTGSKRDLNPPQKMLRGRELHEMAEAVLL